MRKNTTTRARGPSARAAAGAKGVASARQAVVHAMSVGYSEEQLKAVPADAASSRGCGLPLARASLRQGEIVLDLGSGGGLDAFLAAREVGPTGRVIGVEAKPEMVSKASSSARQSHLSNVEFKHAPIERLPLEDSSVDVALSNCVMNHCADKLRAFKEVYRVLKVGGRMCLSDLVASGPFSEAALSDEVWGEWLKVALPKSDYLRAIEKAGFRKVTVEEETTFPMAEKDERLKGRILSITLTARKR